MSATYIIESGIKVRTGLVVQKKGMSQIFDEQGNLIPVTLLYVPDQVVVDLRTQEKHGYNALRVAYGDAKPNNIKKPQRQFFSKIGLEPKRRIAEFLVSADALVDVGSRLSGMHFKIGQKVDLQGTSIGKGFAGVMKRWNFRGLEASHGVSITHRSHGSTGQRQDPGRVFKNKKMAGHLGNETVTVQNLTVVSVSEEKEGFLILVKGAVPGKSGSYLKIFDAVKSAVPNGAYYPACLVEANKD